MLTSPALQSFAAVIQRYLTMEQASKDGRQALLTMASKPCMREVRRAAAAGQPCAPTAFLVLAGSCMLQWPLVFHQIWGSWRHSGQLLRSLDLPDLWLTSMQLELACLSGLCGEAWNETSRPGMFTKPQWRQLTHNNPGCI